MSKPSTISVTFAPDLRGFSSSMRSVTRSARQMRRNIETAPVSAERKAIQRIGREQMTEAIQWFRTTHGGNA